MMKPMKSLTFREIYKKIVYIEDKNSVNVLNKGYQIEIDGDETGILGYGYVDGEQGICFNVFSIVKVEDGNVVKYNDKPMELKINHRVRLEDVYNLNGFEVEYESLNLERYVDRAIEINEKFFESEEKEAIRYNRQIDELRHYLYPDDIQGYVYHKEKNKIEGLWVRTIAMLPTGILAKVITPVSREFNIALEDELEFKLFNIDGTLRLMYIIED
ncbi:MAG: hypothetical protein GXY87_04050 [Tissierellia bacterium]|nr:hypothetical protein [Tissierellia bacterium]